jgi:Zn-finger nucleic acid-binding protein
MGGRPRSIGREEQVNGTGSPPQLVYESERQFRASRAQRLLSACPDRADQWTTVRNECSEMRRDVAFGTEIIIGLQHRRQHCDARAPGHALTRLRIGGVETDVCEDCGGIWLDRLELEKFDHAGSAFGDSLVAHLRQFPPALMDHSIRLRCPRHAEAVMLRRAYSRDVQVEIDECPQCGDAVWLRSG